MVLKVISTYREDDMYWADASADIDVPASAAWKSLERLLIRIIRIPNVEGVSLKIRRVSDDVPMLNVGNTLIAEAATLGGLTKASMSMKITQSSPPHYLRLSVQMAKMHFADVDFRIDSAESGCWMSYRQGFRSRSKRKAASGEQVDVKSRDLPETAEIFNLWVGYARETAGRP